MKPDRRGPRAVLAAGVLAGLGYLLVVAVDRPGALALDYEVFHAAGRAVVAGDRVYGVSLVEGPIDDYVYAPVTLPVVAAFGLLPLRWGFALWTALTVGAGLTLARLLGGVLDRHGVSPGRVDRLLIAGFCVVSVHAAPSLVFGQTNHVVALALAVGFVAAGRRPTRAGVAFAGAALVKVFPAVAGLWLVRRRADATTVRAVGAGLGGLLAGLAFGLAVTRRYLAGVLGRFTRDSAAIDPTRAVVTLRRPATTVLEDPLAVTLAAVVPMVLVVAVVYRELSVEDPIDRLVGVYVTLTATLLALPSLAVYVALLTYPAVPLLYLLEGRPRRLFVAGWLLATPSVRIDDVRRAAGAVGLPVPEVVELLFAAATPPLVGLLVTLVACLLAVRTSGPRRRPGSGPQSEPESLEREDRRSRSDAAERSGTPDTVESPDPESPEARKATKATKADPGSRDSRTVDREEVVVRRRRRHRAPRTARHRR